MSKTRTQLDHTWVPCPRGVPACIRQCCSTGPVWPHTLTTEEVAAREEVNMSRLWGEEEVLKLLAERERYVQGASCAQQMLPAAASSATQQQGVGGRGEWWRETETSPSRHVNLPTTEPQVETIQLCSPEACLSPPIEVLEPLNGKFMFFISAGTFLHTHTHTHTRDGAPPDGQHGRLIKLTRTSDYWTLWNYWIKSVMQQSLFLARRRPYLSPAHPGCTHRVRQWSDEAHQNRDNKCSMF